MDCKLLIAVACCLALLHDTEAATATGTTSTENVANGAASAEVALPWTGGVTNGYCAVTSGAATISPTTAGTSVVSCTLTLTGTTDYSAGTTISIGYKIIDNADASETPVSLTLTITKNPYYPSIITACAAYSAAVDTVVASFTDTVTPVSGDTVTYSITNGNTGTVFDITGSTLTVAAVLPSTAAVYTLTLQLDPADTGSVNGEATILVAVGDWCQGSSGVAGMAASIVLVTTAILFSLMKQL